MYVFCTKFYLYNLCAVHVVTRRFSSQTYCFRIIVVVVVSARDLSPLPFRDDYRNSLTPQDNEKTRTLAHTHISITTHGGGGAVCIAPVYCSALYTVVAAAAIVTRGLFGTSLSTRNTNVKYY